MGYVINEPHVWAEARSKSFLIGADSSMGSGDTVEMDWPAFEEVERLMEELKKHRPKEKP